MKKTILTLLILGCFATPLMAGYAQGIERTFGGVLTDGVTATTQSDDDNSTLVATTAYVDSMIETENYFDRSGTELSTQTAGDSLILTGDLTSAVYFGTLDEDVTTSTQTANDNSTLVATTEYADANIRIREKYTNRIHGMLNQDKNLTVAILGDSTVSGVEGRGSVYGECGDKNQPMGVEWLVLNMIFNSPHLLPFDESVYDTDSVPESTHVGPFLWRNMQFRENSNPDVTFTYTHPDEEKRDTMTVLYLSRDSAAAPTFDVVSDGNTYTIDTFKADQTFGAYTISQQGYNFESREIPIDTSGLTFSFDINNVYLASGDGTAVIVGFYYGKAPYFRNFAVSSSTLLNESTANVTQRGITTDGRLQAAYDIGANVFFLGWGTNDSKPDVSTPAAYKADYETRIAEIRAESPEAIIIFLSCPAGTGGTYTDNVTFFDKMKEVAIENDCCFFDIEELIYTFDRDDVVADFVHPNTTGYNIIGEAATRMFGFESRDNYTKASTLDTRVQDLEDSGDATNFLAYAEYDVLTKLANAITPSTFVEAIYFDGSSGLTLSNRASGTGDLTMSANINTMTNKNVGALRTITTTTSHSWEIPDNDNLSFTDDTTDSGFSVVYAGQYSGPAGSYMIAKRDVAPVANAEWQFISRLSDSSFALVLWSEGAASNYMGRSSGTQPSTSDYITLMGTYDGLGANEGIKLYENGVQTDDNNWTSGGYWHMHNTDASIRNGRDNNGTIEQIMASEWGFIGIIDGELTPTQAKSVDKILRSALGVDEAVTLA